MAPSDLAQSMGHIGDIEHPQVVEAMETSISKIIAAGRTAGTTVTTENVGGFVEQGVKFFYTSVSGWINAGGNEFLKAVRD